MPAARPAHPILAWPGHVKRLVVVLMDIGLSLVATWLAFSLRLDALHWPTQDQWVVYAVAPCLALPVFIRLGLYRAIFRYSGVAAMVATAQATVVYAVLLLLALALMQVLGLSVLPRSLGILQPLIFLLLVLSSRVLVRTWLDGLARQHQHAPIRLLIYGAGQAGAEAAAALMNSLQPYQLLGFVDDDAAKVGRTLHGARVFGPSELPQTVARLRVQHIVLALPSASRERRNQILRSLQPLPVHVRTLPRLADLASGRVSVQDIHELDIDDLLGREPVPPHPDLLARNLAGRTVLVSGAGGSIGAELCRQILRERPERLVLLDHSEIALYTIHQELQNLAQLQGPPVELVPVLGSVVHAARMQALCRQWRPATVYHAAAYKHVPLVEANAAEGVLNNVLGTLNLARAAMAHGTQHFVLISTDKAVRPTNAMGASKRVAELILQALAAASQRPATCFSMVRFGNVLGSSGSVVPLFRRQLAAGGPLTVTHPEVTRYFMTIAEAAQLVLQAGAMAQGGDVFVLDMGQPVKIMDLALRMVDLSGLRVQDSTHPDGDIAITVTGLRPGEKLYEELLIGDNPQATEHPRILRAQEEFLPWSALDAPLQALLDAARQCEDQGLQTQLGLLVPDYHPEPLH
jgi:FlaA1/EpsC-like NDP-sugar epimerase